MSGQITEYAIPGSSGAFGVDWLDLVTGSDGTLWAMDSSTTPYQLVHISLQGKIIGLYPLVNDVAKGGTDVGLVAGACESFWFTDMGDNAIGRIAFR